MGTLSEKRLFLLDMDGTIYLDDDLFDGTVDFLDYVKSIGGKYLFLTNNSSRSVGAYVQKMARLGIETTAEDFLTSVDALVLYLQANCAGKLCYASGTETFKEQLRQGGIRITDKLEDGIEVLVAGFDTELTFKKLEDSCILLNRGVEFIAANPDWVCPTWYGYVPDCGSVCEMLFRATGRRPKFIGKPQPEMALLAMERFGYSKEQTMMVGDRLYTDIACGINAGIDACFVLSGEGTLEDLKTSETQPTMVYKNIRALLNAMPRKEKVTLRNDAKETRSKRYKLLTKPSVHQVLKEYAESSGDTFNNLVNTLMENFIRDKKMVQLNAMPQDETTETKSKKLDMLTKPSVHQALTEYAKINGDTFNNLVNTLMENFIQMKNL